MKNCFNFFCLSLLLQICVSLLESVCNSTKIIKEIFQFAIKCDFRYSEDDKNYPENLIDSLVARSFPIETTSKGSKEFSCDDADDGTNLVDFVRNRFDGSTGSIDDEVDSESLCCTTKKIIRPKTLPSVADNKLIKIVNHGEFFQTVEIEECT